MFAVRAVGLDQLPSEEQRLGLLIPVAVTGGEVSEVKGYAPLKAKPGPEPKVLPGQQVLRCRRHPGRSERSSHCDRSPAQAQSQGPNPLIEGHLYALRNLVGRCFSKLEHSRRLATQDCRQSYRLHPRRVRPTVGQSLRQQDLVCGAAEA